MKKLRWIWIGLLAAGAVAALVALGGCTDGRTGPEGYRGGRYTAEGAPGNEGMPPTLAQGRSARQGLGGRSESPVYREQRQGQAQQAVRKADCYEPREGGRYAVPAEDRRGNRHSGEIAKASEVGSDGRRVVETGELLTLAGSLEIQDSEWYLVGEGTRFVLHLGNARYVESTGIRLREGAAVEVRGFVDDEEVAVVSIVVDGERFSFRAEDGTPLWAGRGRQAADGQTAGGARSGAGGRNRSDTGSRRGLNG